MFLRRGASGLIAASLLASSALAIADPSPPMQPIKPWVVHFDVDECYAERTYGTANKNMILGLRPMPSGSSFELLVARKQFGPADAEQLLGTVDFGRGPIKAWLLRYGVKPGPMTVDKYRVNRSAVEATTATNLMIFRNERGSVDRFAVSSMAPLLAKLDQCNEDLRHYWNMTADEAGKIAKSARGDVRTIFSSDDYPTEAFNRNQGGAVQFLLFVNERGSVTACHVLQPSGIPSLDGMGCQVILKRARFEPALDKKGQPIRDTVVTPMISWRMDR